MYVILGSSFLKTTSETVFPARMPLSFDLITQLPLDLKEVEKIINLSLKEDIGKGGYYNRFHCK